MTTGPSASASPAAGIPARGRFITLEGVDGAGKSTHLDAVAAQLRAAHLSVVVTREPGGTPVGESLRAVLLHQPMQLETETLLMFAARCEHLRQVIRPALARGQWVVCDRFTDATYAYQGGGRGLGFARVAALETWVHSDVQPDHTLFFDVPLEVARARLAHSGHDLDRFEREGTEFFARTRAAYHQRAALAPRRVHVIDSSRSMDETRATVQRIVQSWLPSRNP